MFAELEGTVGLSQGGGVGAVRPINFSLIGGPNPPVALTPGDTPVEDFTAGGQNFDLGGYALNFALAPGGVPTLVF